MDFSRVIKKCITPIFCLGVSMYFTWIVGNYATKRDIDRNTEPLYDVIHANTEKINPAIVDWILVVDQLIFIPYLIYIYKKNRNFNVYERYCFFTAFIFLIRSLCIYVTSLPNPEKCSIDDHHIAIFRLSVMYCGDMMFSGHVSHFTISVLFFTHFNKSMKARFFVWILVPVYMFMVSMSRLHYTIDVLVSFFINVLGWFSMLYLFPIKNRVQEVHSLDSILSWG
jgi:hypothetical protein